MIRIVARHEKRIIKIWLTAVISTLLTGGIVSALDQITADENISNILISFFIGFVLLNNIYANAKQIRNYFNVVLISGKGKIEVRGLYDSGNVLKGGEKREPVHIASEKVFSILQENSPKIEVAYKSLGNECGIIEAYRFDKMEIINNDKKVELFDILVGKASASLLENVAYDIILNEAVFTDTKGM